MKKNPNFIYNDKESEVFMKLIINSTPVALWLDIIHDAEAACAMVLKEDLESYLVFLLVRYTNKPEVVKQVIATEFLQGLNFSANKRELALQEVGDKCLIISGLFPTMATKRMVKIGYFVNIGQAAYDKISKSKKDIYSSLAREFVPLMDILQSVRQYSKEYPDLLPLQAYDLWNQTGSQRALSVLKQCTNGVPVNSKK